MTRVTQAHRDMYEEVGAVRVEGVFDASFVARLTSQIDASIAALRDGTFARRGAGPVFRDIEFEDHDGYVREVGQLVSRYAARSGARAQSEGRLVLDLTLLATAHGLRTPPELSLLGKTLLNLEAVSKALDPDLDVKSVVEGHLEHVMRERLKKSLSPARLATEAMELQGLVREAPRKLSDLLALLSENRLQVRLVGLDDSLLMENVQKIANRISTGLIVAALIVASAMLMQVERGPRLLGYPALALLLFFIAALLGLGIVVSALLRDRNARRP